MGLFGKKDDKKKNDVPLAKVIGSKGKGGWLGRKSGDRKDDNIVKKLGGYGTTGC